MTAPTHCPMCLQPWDREAVIDRRKAQTAARRARLAAQPSRPRPVQRDPNATAWLGRFDLPEPPKGDAA
jgi:hypothetical protein